MIAMVAVDAKTVQKIKRVQSQVEPYIIDMIKQSNEFTCPFRMLKEGFPNQDDAKDIVTRVARMLYKNGLLNKLEISLSDEEAFDALLYAFGYWGGKTLFKHGDNICRCREKCY